MLNPVYYIIDADMLPELQTGGVVALCAEVAERNKLKAVYKKVQTINGDVSFCLYISAAHVADEQCILDMVSFFFLPNYYKEGNVPVVILAINEQKEKETFSKALAHAAGKQGFAQLVQHCVPLQQKEKLTFYNAVEVEVIKSDYANELKSLSSKSFFIKASSAADLKSTEEFLISAEAVFARENEFLYLCRKKEKALEAKLRHNQILLNAAESEIQAMTSYLNLLQSASQAASLQNYYTNEYEVLPRWYKQFGHVLKVIMGKRTLSSLLNDTEKKYKS